MMRSTYRGLARAVGRRFNTLEDTMGAAYRDAGSGAAGPDRHVTQLQFSIDNQKPGSLLDALTPFREEEINFSSITTRQAPDQHNLKAVTVFADIEGHVKDANVERAIETVKKQTLHFQVIQSCTIPWYATHISDIDNFKTETPAEGDVLTSDHPGLHDKVYRERRDMIAAVSKKYRYGLEIPRVTYTADENKTWGLVWDNLMTLYPTHACKEYNYNLALMVENCGFRPDRIPQLEDISQYLKYRTGFSIRPATGLLSPRDFLNALAFRVFHSTQYIRHHSRPYHTPEPDVAHELMGHVVMFADPDFADFTQSIGMASLGASDEIIQKLASCYFFSIELGLCRQEGKVRAYGAALLSSFGELRFAVGSDDDKPEYVPWDPEVAGAVTDYPMSSFQPRYFVADSFKDATERMKDYSNTFTRPFTLEYNPYTQSIKTITKNSEAYLKGL
eukprot:TRINITY_DN680_c0_g3_i1.p1 TRINITY_DN680_c0_g3~~TRINITY_DN680_c0_g3_i1.p1  ORF type:complete len:447 (+),score=194.15 TRINITY_DN680_c0_g3_i1:88-1428(+)